MRKLASLALTAFVVTACGGGGGSSGLPRVNAGKTGAPAGTGAGARSTVAFKIRYSAQRHSAGNTRRALYVSPSMASIVVKLTMQNGSALSPALAYAVNVTNASACTTVAGVTTCTLSIPAAIGVDVFSVETYDAAQTSPTPSAPVGNLLSTGTATTTVVANTANAFTVTLNGVVAALALEFSNPTPAEGSPATIGVTVTYKDADGNPIVGPGTYPAVALTNSDVSGATTLSTASVTGPGAAVALTYTGAPSNAKITATATGVAPASASLLTQGSGGWGAGLASPADPSRSFFAAAAVNGQLYLVGGEDDGDWDGPAYDLVQAYDPVANTWTDKAPMPTGRVGPSAAVVNGILYVIGGRIYPGGYGTGAATNAVEAYDPATNTWTTKAPIPTARFEAGAAVVGGKIYVVGGNAGDFGNGPVYNGAFNGTVLNTVEVYDPASNSWSSAASLPTARAGLTVNAVNGKIYAIGGFDGSNQSGTGVVEAYDPVANTWTTKTADPTPRQWAASAVVRNTIYELTSFEGYNSPSDSVEAYDPATDTWTTKAPFPDSVILMTVDAINDIIYAQVPYGNYPSFGPLRAYTP